MVHFIPRNKAEIKHLQFTKQNPRKHHGQLDIITGERYYDATKW